MCKISVIIPVYNAEKYLTNCIDSVLQQTYQDVEVILVNNNSIDNSLKICMEYQENDSRVVVLNEEKKGAAVARNTGISYATGEYVTFLDSDDYINLDAYRCLVKMLEDNNYDAVCFSYNIIDENGKKLGWYEPELKKYIKTNNSFSGIEMAKIFLTSRDIEGFGWNKIFRRELLLRNDFGFDESKIAYEDMPVIFDLLLKSNRVGLCPQKLYYYRQLASSLTHISYDNKGEEYNMSLSEIAKMSKKVGLHREAAVFLVTRCVWREFSKLKSDNANQINFPYSFLKCVVLILFYLKTEKIKTFIKLVYIRLHLI